MDAKRSGLFRKNNVPQNTLHKQDLGIIVRHVLEQFLKMRIFGRWWWESSHKECGLHQK
jgi:phosphoadenosine phosphosulfate reductase